MRRRNKLLAYSAIAGATLGIGFIIPYLWPVSFIGATLFIFITLNANTFKESVLYACLSGFVLWLFALGAFFFSVIPLYWYGISSMPLQILLVTSSLLFVASITSVGFIIAGLTIRILYSGSWKDVFIVPSVWVLSEYAGSLIFYIISIGPGSYFGAHFSFGWLGYLLAYDVALLQFASIGGVYILGFIIFFVGTILFKIIENNKNCEIRKKYVYTAIIIVVVWIVASGIISKTISNDGISRNNKTLSMVSVSSSQPPALTITDSQEKKYFEDIYNEIKLLKDVDVLVLPENIYFLKALMNTNRIKTLIALKNIGANNEFPIVIDSRDVTNIFGYLWSKASYFKGSEIVRFGYKQLLVPIGEYVPNIYYIALRFLGLNDLLETAKKVRAYEPGRVNAMAKVKGVVISTRFCFEVISPSLYRKDVLEGAEILVNVSSLSWFNGSPIVYEQLKRVAKVRAVENGRWYVQSGNLSSSLILNQFGKVVEESNFNETGVAQAQVPALANVTPYTRFGSRVLFIPLLLILVFGRRALTKRRGCAQRSH